jgi:hypothetical protein
MSPKAKAQSARTADSVDVEALIRARAHELYEARGREDGHDVEDWLRAEQEIRGTQADKVAA